MNTEQFFEGGGASSTQTYILEIAIILLGAFILGYLLRVLLNSKYKSTIVSLEEEISVLKAKKTEVVHNTVSAVPFDTTDYDTKIRDQQREIDKLNLKLSEYLNAKISAETSLSAIETEIAELKTNAISDSTKPEIKIDNEEEIKSNSQSQIPSYKESNEENSESILEEKIIEQSFSIADKSEPIAEIEPMAESSIASVSVESNVPALKEDLKKIEGIGPKIESLLNEAGIYTYKDLKEAKPDYIREVLVAAGPNYAVHDPATWSEQATLANNGNWDALSRLQEVLKGGKRK